MHPSPFGRRWWNHILRLKLEAHIFVHIISFPLCNFWGYAWRSLPSQQALVSSLKVVLFLNSFVLKETMNSYHPLFQSPGNTQHLARANIWRTFSMVTGFFEGYFHVSELCWKLMSCIWLYWNSPQENVPLPTRILRMGLNPWTVWIYTMIVKQCWEVHLISIYLDRLNINYSMA